VGRCVWANGGFLGLVDSIKLVLSLTAVFFAVFLVWALVGPMVVGMKIILLGASVVGLLLLLKKSQEGVL